MSEFIGVNTPNFVKELPNDDACKTYLTRVRHKKEVKLLRKKQNI